MGRVASEEGPGQTMVWRLSYDETRYRGLPTASVSRAATNPNLRQTVAWRKIPYREEG